MEIINSFLGTMKMRGKNEKRLKSLKCSSSPISISAANRFATSEGGFNKETMRQSCSTPILAGLCATLTAGTIFLDSCCGHRPSWRYVLGHFHLAVDSHAFKDDYLLCGSRFQMALEDRVQSIEGLLCLAMRLSHPGIMGKRSSHCIEKSFF